VLESDRRHAEHTCLGALVFRDFVDDRVGSVSAGLIPEPVKQQVIVPFEPFVILLNLLSQLPGMTQWRV
jgi:hypothetical protein